MDFYSASRVAIAAVFLVAGVLHFATPKPFLQIMPPWFPFPRFGVYASGLVEGALGAAILLPPDVAPGVAEAAGWGLIALLVAVFPANVYMFQAAERFPRVPRWALAARLPLQGVLIGWVYFTVVEAGAGS